MSNTFTVPAVTGVTVQRQTARFVWAYAPRCVTDPSDCDCGIACFSGAVEPFTFTNPSGTGTLLVTFDSADVVPGRSWWLVTTSLKFGSAPSLATDVPGFTLADDRTTTFDNGSGTTLYWRLALYYRDIQDGDLPTFFVSSPTQSMMVTVRLLGGALSLRQADVSHVTDHATDAYRASVPRLTASPDATIISLLRIIGYENSPAPPNNFPGSPCSYNRYNPRLSELGTIMSTDYRLPNGGLTPDVFAWTPPAVLIGTSRSPYLSATYELGPDAGTGTGTA